MSAIQFTCYLFLARATTWLSTGTAVCRRERCNRVLLQYSRAQLFKMTPARLTLDLISHLRTMQIGVDLSRKRSRRGGRRKQKQSNLNEHLPPVSLSLIERSISDDRDFLQRVDLKFLSALLITSIMLQPFASPA